MTLVVRQKASRSTCSCFALLRRRTVPGGWRGWRWGCLRGPLACLPLALLCVHQTGAQIQRPEDKLTPHLRMLASGDPRLEEVAKRHLSVKRGPSNGEPAVGVLLQFTGDPEALRTLLQAHRARVRVFAGDIATADIPIPELVAVAASPSVVRIEGGGPFKPALDVSVNQTGANRVWGTPARPLPPTQWNGNAGANAVIGIVDVGIDLTHPDFIDSSGNTRILALWDQTATGTSPKGLYGNECTSAQINALRDRTDLVTTNWSDGTASVLLGNGGGNLSGAVNIPTGDVPNSVAVADFNGDGFQDLAVANGNDGTVSILAGNGAGGFSNLNNTLVVTPVPAAAGEQVRFIAAADLNRDGNQDLVVVLGLNGVSVLLGNGNGTFNSPVFYPVGNQPTSVVVADLNGDGAPDLVVTNYLDSSVTVLLNNNDGTGAFTPLQDFPVWQGIPPVYPQGQFPSYVAVGDFNEDGKPDLAVASWGRGGAGVGNDLSILLGNGDGTFGAASPIYTGHFELAVVVGDFNGDGHADLALSGYGSGNITILLGKGDGTFGLANDMDHQYTSGGIAAGQTTLVSGDFNRDGKLDLASLITTKGGNFYDSVGIYLGNGDGTFQVPQVIFPTGSTNSTGLAAGNFHASTCTELDLMGHGTHVAGIAAGNGSAGANNNPLRAPYRYIGMAPEASLIVVKAVDLSDHSSFLDAVKYIEEKAASLKPNLPVAINMSFGVYDGPRDGTSTLDMGLDNLSGPGRVIVVAAANDAQKNLHASGGLGNGGTVQVGFTVPPGLSTISYEVWYPGSDRIGIKITAPTGDCSTFVYPGTTLSQSGCGSPGVSMTIENSSPPNPINGDRVVKIELDGGPGTPVLNGVWSLTLTGAGCGFTPCVTKGSFDIWGYCPGSLCMSFNPDHVDSNKTITDIAAATDVITAGSYITKDSWVSPGAALVLEARSEPLGSLSFFSSLGPRRSCSNLAQAACTATVQKPEITAPGEEIMSSYAAGTDTQTCFVDAASGQNDRSQCLDVDGMHVVSQGTSMAAPHVTGAVALLLAQNPTLNPCQVKLALANSRTDQFTSFVPNNSWGFGKLAIDLAIAAPVLPAVTAPNVVGLSQQAAQAALAAAGMAVGVITFIGSSTVAPGTVISQSPTVGSCGSQGAAVDLVIAGVPVPDVIGLPKVSAEGAIATASLAVGSENHAGSATVPVGDVLSESPAAGTYVAPGSLVNLVLSGIPVPAVAGLTQAASTAAITAAQLVVGNVTYVISSSAPPGTVISQNPPAATYVLLGSSVGLVVAGVQIPDVSGLGQAAAGSALVAAGLALGPITQSGSPTVPVGAVITEDPAAGTIVALGSPVGIVLSTGTGQITVPNLIGQTQAAAAALIKNVGLVTGAVTNVVSLAAPGTVVLQSPAAGTQVNAGTAVALSVSSGSPNLPAGGAISPLNAVIAVGQSQQFSLSGMSSGGTGSTSIAIGYEHACALASGSVQCWGSNRWGQLGNGSGNDSLVPVTVTGITSAKAITSGNFFTCALLSNGTVQCWGENASGQLGAGTAGIVGVSGPAVCDIGVPCSPTPVTVPGITGATAIAGGTSILEFNGGSTCAVLSNGTVQCWGDNSYGQLGLPQTGPITCNPSGCSIAPVTVNGISRATAIANGGDHVCALLSGGTVQCWGENLDGQLGNGAPQPCAGGAGGCISLTPVAVSGISTATTIAAGGFGGCASLANGTVQCWGENIDGQLGNGVPSGPQSCGSSRSSLPCSTVPVTVTGITTATAVSSSAGGLWACALLSSAGVQCWGENALGNLGNGTTVASPLPVAVTGISTATGIAAGPNDACARVSNGGIECWGANDSGQLGVGNNAGPQICPLGSSTFACSKVPVAVNGVSATLPVIWSSTNPAVATIDQNSGLATAMSAGTTSITATVGNASGNTNLTVTGPGLSVIGFSVLFGAQTYNVSTSTRNRIPWQITGVRAVFSEPVMTGGAASLTGATVTGFTGLGTNTLTWSINPVGLGALTLALSGSGSSPLADGSGNPLNGGAPFLQNLKVLWGDFNDDGVVSAADLVGINNSISGPYNIFADLNGDGVVNTADLQIARSRVGTSLP